MPGSASQAYEPFRSCDSPPTVNDLILSDDHSKLKVPLPLNFTVKLAVVSECVVVRQFPVVPVNCTFSVLPSSTKTSFVPVSGLKSTSKYSEAK